MAVVTNQPNVLLNNRKFFFYGSEDPLSKIQFHFAKVMMSAEQVLSLGSRGEFVSWDTWSPWLLTHSSLCKQFSILLLLLASWLFPPLTFFPSEELMRTYKVYQVHQNHLSLKIICKNSSYILSFWEWKLNTFGGYFFLATWDLFILWIF